MEIGVSPPVVVDAQAVSLDTMWVLFCAFLVFFMNAGFGCVEAGFCRSKNAVNILAKNFVVFGIASLSFWAVGFSLMFADGGSLSGWGGWLLSGADNSPASGALYRGVYRSLNWASVPLDAKFFFQLAFAGTAATIVSGCVAERVHYAAFLIFSLILAAVMYPIAGHWIWGGGWLQGIGMWDFAGSTVVHSVGGWAGLAGILLLGPRIGKYGKDGKTSPIPGHSMSLVFIGGMILWLGWFGFNPGSTMAISGDNARTVSHVVVATNLACISGLLAATLTSWFLTGKPDFGMSVNGALAGLVGITAGCAFVSPGSSLVIGLVAGVIVVFGVRMFDRLRLDDPVGALSVHLLCGIWGTLAVGLFAETSAPGGIDANGLFMGGGPGLLKAQATGVAAVGALVFSASIVIWAVLKATMGIRVSASVEVEGLDVNEMGGEAYPREPSIDVMELLHKSALGRHESEIIAEEIVKGPRPATIPPKGPTYHVRLSGVDMELFMERWRRLCGGASEESGPEFREVYRHFTLFQNGALRFRGGDPGRMREDVEVLARSISTDAEAVLAQTSTERIKPVNISEVATSN